MTEPSFPSPGAPVPGPAVPAPPLTDALLAAGAVDRLRLRTCPALVGAGRRLAPSDLGMRLMRLGSVEALPTGHVVSEYLPDPVRR